MGGNDRCSPKIRRHSSCCGRYDGHDDDGACHTAAGVTHDKRGLTKRRRQTTKDIIGHDRRDDDEMMNSIRLYMNKSSIMVSTNVNNVVFFSL